MSELKKRFIPVRLQAVQSSLFHDRKQKSNESVDAYAQELRTLFYRAYPQAQQGTQETEQMARTMLANQFAVGLRQEIKIKVAGIEGTFEQLLAKAKFEEAKLRDIGNNNSNSNNGNSNNVLPTRRLANMPRGERSNRTYTITNNSQKRCYNCNATGHFPEIVRYGDVPYL